MVSEIEKPRVTEIRVRIDCNGCVQKVKKALRGINGIQDIYINIPQQKLTILGCVDPEDIVKAIKKTRKHATICSETKPSLPIVPPSESGEPHEPVESPKERENSPPTKPAQEPSGSNKAEEVHVVHNYPPNIGHKDRHEQVYNASVTHYSSSPSPIYKHERLQPIHVNHSYNTYKPTPYVTEYTQIRPPPQYTHLNRPEPQPQQSHYTHYNRPEPPQPYTNYGREEPPPPPPPHYTHYTGEYHNNSYGNGNNVTSIFSDDNPNACTIV